MQKINKLIQEANGEIHIVAIAIAGILLLILR